MAVGGGGGGGKLGDGHITGDVTGVEEDEEEEEDDDEEKEDPGGTAGKVSGRTGPLPLPLPLPRTLPLPRPRFGNVSANFSFFFILRLMTTISSIRLSSSLSVKPRLIAAVNFCSQNSIHYVKSTEFDLHVGKGFFHGIYYCLLAVVVDEDKIEVFAGFAANFNQFSQQLLITFLGQKSDVFFSINLYSFLFF